MSMELLPATQRAVRHWLATTQVKSRVPALVAAVVRDGRPVWTGGWGDVDGRTPDANTQYRIGSITKTLVAVQVMRLVDEGKVGLNDTLETHLPGTGAGGVTVESLLAHTAALNSESPGLWWERVPGDFRTGLPDVLGDRPLDRPAGPRFHYSNPGYALLGALITQVRGEHWYDVLKREVLEPLGMNRTTLMPVAPHARGWATHPWADVLLPEPAEDAGHMAPAGQIWSTAADLAAFAAFFLDGDDRVLSASGLELMRTPSSAPELVGEDGGYGLGMQLLHRGDRRLAGHTGSMPGFVATVWVSHDDGLGAVVLANVTSGLPVGTAAADLLTTVAGLEPRIPDPWRPLSSVDPAVLDLAGPWYWGPSLLAVRVQADGYLTLGGVAGGGGRATKLKPVGPDEWIGLTGYYTGERLRVIRDAAGAVTHLDMGTFVLTRRPYDPAAPVPGGVDPDGWRAMPM